MGDKGNVVMMAALVMVVVLGFLALGLDLGLVLVNRAALLRAADAAALAGASKLPTGVLAAEAEAKNYGQLNGLLESEMAVTAVLADQNVQVTAYREVDLYFARILGIQKVPVSVQSKAQVSVVTGINNIVPFGIINRDFVYGEQYKLKEGAQPGDGVYKGNFGPLALGGTGADIYFQNIKYGYKGWLRVGDQVLTETGNMSGKTADGIAYRIKNADPAICNFENPRWDCSRVVVVPVIDGYKEGGRHLVTIVGFAAFYLEGTTRSGADNYVLGRFLEMMSDAEGGDSEYYGLRTCRLIE
ncbi:MAG TPA: hypothetical protein GXX29_03780 [Firmicutes bacterium]|nr:hypothetical protein [Bacillota bacterium]